MMDERDELKPGVGAKEGEVGRRLRTERPVPTAAFRGTLGRQLAAEDAGYGPRPERLRLIVLSYTAAGGTVIALGALIATGLL